VKDIVTSIEDEFSDIHIKTIKSDGGASKNDFLLQYTSDILQYRVDRAEQSEMTSQGVAFLAGLAVKFWESKEELAKLRKTGKVFEPNKIQPAEIHKKFKKWQTAVRGTLDWTKP
jgi:glycerol kinase